MTTYAILLGGTVTPTPRLLRQLEGARFIAADGGIVHAARFDAEVELWVGDFDSTDQALAARYGHVRRQVHPPAKDATDGELALDEAVRRGARRIVMVGGLGGASDHAFSHLPQMLALAARGIEAHVTSGHEEAWPLLPGRLMLQAAAGSRLSIIGFSALEALSLTNVRWPLDRRDVPLGSTLTLSNEALGDVGIALEEGLGVIILTPIGDEAVS